FAGYDHHVGFYATPTSHEAFAKELSKYKQGKGSVQFPHTEALPLKLVERIIKFRAQSLAKKSASSKPAK
ncbi:MAG: iron chaperone, partial [Cytophagales bacterium]